MAQKPFKAESKRLLDLMINSIYTHKEIFLRELISNASDAIDKLCYLSLTDDRTGLGRSDFCIRIVPDQTLRTLTVSDNGIGMTKNELEENLGVIAKSGSLQFKSQADEELSKDIDIIGQFGVGFYSAFMVSSKVTVRSRAFGADEAWEWTSAGSEGFSIAPCVKDTAGTDIIMEIKTDTEEEAYGEFLEVSRLQSLIKKYSDYIRYPIKMDIEKQEQRETGEKNDDGSEKHEYITVTREETINSMIPIWQRSKSEVSDEDCAAFYKERYFDYEDPQKVIRVNAEGTVSYNALLFIPSRTPYDYYTGEYKRGLQLFARGVLIMDNCADLIPEYFRFVRGVVDSPDLSLNISREMLQHDRQLRVIGSSLEKKIRAELVKMLENEPEAYEKFYQNFGLQLKYGIVNDYGANRDKLSDLILFFSGTEKKLVTLSSYIARMKEDQKYIYYACGESIPRIDTLPQAELIRDKGYEILYLTDGVDEFVTSILGKFKEKEFRSINAPDPGLSSAEEIKEVSEKEAENKELLDFIKASIGNELTAVSLTGKLKTHPVCLSTRGEITLEMEKYFTSLPGNDHKPRAQRVLELNPTHPVFTKLQDSFSNDKEKAGKYAKILYCQALLIAGLPLENPSEYADLVCDLF